MTDLRELLESVAAGEMSPDEAARTVRGYARVGDYARLDTSRVPRKGIPEAILADGKGAEQLVEIARECLRDSGRVIITRIEAETAERVVASVDADSEHEERARTLVLRSESYEPPETDGVVGVVTAGTSDVPVAEEAAVTAREMGCETETVYDVGVAGVHRLLDEAETLDACDALVVAAGREGALPTVVAGLVAPPVIGLPVSIGYGFGGEGEAALTSMLQSCAVLSVVNIDAGFVAGAQAAQIAMQGDGG